MRAGEIASLLARDTEGICQMLLPDGKRSGNEWCVGSVRGEPGDSCRVHLTGSKAGVWKDFSSHERGGDLLDLWAAVKAIPLPEAIDEARSYLGITDTRFHGYRPPDRRPERPKCHAPKGEVLQWLKGRGLSGPAIEAYKIAATDREVVFPYLHGSELMFCKLRRIDDKHRMRVQPDSVPALFGWQAIPDDAREVVICEGELDAPSWWMMGYPALSVPNGAQGFSWVETEFDRLERFDRIHIAFDVDEAGQKGALELADRLGIERCQLVDTAPWKDANDVIQAGQHMAGAQMIAKAKPIAPHELKAAPEFSDAVENEFYPKPGEARGFHAPFRRCEGKVFFDYGAITIISGFSGHGKSELSLQVVNHALWQGERACIFSGEIKPERMLYRSVRQAAALENGNPTRSYIRAVMDWYANKLWLFDLTGTAKVKRLLEVFRYAYKRFGIRLFVVDSLLKCGIADDDYVAQKAFVEDLCDFKNECDVHILLITHSRKRENEISPSGKLDVRGSGTITDLVDNVSIVWRNKKKEEKLSEVEAVNADTPPDVATMPDAKWIWEKQRELGWEGRINLWRHQNSLSFVDKQGRKPRPVIEWEGIHEHEA